MIPRIILTVVIIVVCFFTISIMEQKVAPNVSADLAVNQLKEDGSREEMRILENSHNWIDPVCYLASLSLISLIWYKPIKKYIKEIDSTEQV